MRRPGLPIAVQQTVFTKPSAAARTVESVEHRDLARRCLRRLDECVEQVAMMRYCEDWSRALRVALYDGRGRK